MTEKPILVIGGTGKTGSRVVRRLESRGVPVRVASRRSELRFDWRDESTWGPALEGASGVYIVQYDAQPSKTRTLAARAAEAGVERLVLLSARGVEIPDYYGESNAVSEGFLTSEAAVRESGLAWTVLRPGWFAQNFDEGFFNDGILAGELRLPAGDGAASWIDVDDIAAVAVAALTEDGHAGRIYELSGPSAVPLDEALGLINKATGRSARYVPLTLDEFVAENVANGATATEAKLWAAALLPVSSGQERKVSEGVRQALGRDAADFASFVESAAAAGAWRR
ncbi:NAD(P)H-binding protein [Streptomyces sp. NPDC057638]|uniref:NAD(P)H-binding protein n=1 Tax=Streptomyces sp. NPDC057638 TaxID=3346190 RepID=UPI003688E3E9